MTAQYLVTGGAGFIGSHVLEGIQRAGHDARVFDDFSTGNRDNFAHLDRKPTIAEGCLTDEKAVQEAVRGAEVVVHLGAIASVQRGIDHPEGMHAINATGTMNVLNAARQEGVRRVIFAGSASAYGLPQGEVQSEDDPLSPLSTYAAAKLASEMYCQAFAATYELETVRLRFFNIYGPRQRADSPYSGVIALFVRALSEGRAPTIFGDGKQSRDFTSVHDVVRVVLQATSAPDVSGKVYNIGTGHRISILELAATLSKLMGTELVPNHGPERIGDVRHSCADIRRAKEDLGYDPQVSLEEGLRETLAWYREQ